MAAISAQRPAGVDVKLPLQIAALDASIGRKARLQESARKGPESAPKPPFHCVGVTGVTPKQNHAPASLSGMPEK
jgi:hypothetical protein